MPTVLHVSPHPDDESIAAPCTLLALQKAGWDVVNAAVSLGRPGQHERRRVELSAALAVPEFEGVEWGLDISRGKDLASAARRLTRLIREFDRTRGIDLIVGPHPREGHHGHATVARAVRQAVWGRREPLTWWMWSVWSDLPMPTLVVDCPVDRLEISETMLEQHAGEIARTDYRAMQRPARVVNAVRGIEKTFGYGADVPPEARGIEHAELLTEVTARGRQWMVGRPRVLDPDQALDGVAWDRLRDWSILSTSRLRWLYRPTLLSVHRWRSVSEPGASRRAG